ncbi:carbonic anhydrase [Aspergillus granulosus]|uniref:Carbonic anhydrase n=1 Tax=Aspergillus granulosus TaxID=176169 RepID=A0ABR4HVE2_9EURO
MAMNIPRALSPRLLAPLRRTAVPGPLAIPSHKASLCSVPANPATCPDTLTALLKRNKAWAARTALQHPCLFPELADGQEPEILWIGCSDSRCPETTLLDLRPGDVFVHRNIANVLHPSDLSSSAVIEYAVRHLHVKHVVLCGHTNCGGVAAAMGDKSLGILDPWLLPLRELREAHQDRLDSLPPNKAALTLVELNVLAGVKTLRRMNVVSEAIRKGLKVYGLVYDVGSGILQELVSSKTDKMIKRQFTSESFKSDL